MLHAAHRWVEDSWHDNYDVAPTDGSAWLRGGDPSFRVVRGGSWRNESELVRAAVASGDMSMSGSTRLASGSLER
jgi:formylglycine-generating enzyme required for sulfatase activity